VTVTIRLSTAGPHSPDYTRRVADTIAEAVRVLNHATLNHTGQALAYPADADAVLEALCTAAERLPQLLDQLSGWLTGELAGGRAQVGYGRWAGNPVAAASVIREWLRQATAAAGELRLALRGATAVTTTISAAPGAGDQEG
jgi:hypothetical protein